MGMKARALPLLFVAAALAVPALAAASSPLVENPNFDGTRARPAGDPVRVGASTDDRSPEQIARDEQAKSDARPTLKAASMGEDLEIVPPKPKEWMKAEHVTSSVKGAMIGLLVGSLWGLAGLGIGALIGGLIGYGLSRLTA